MALTADLTSPSENATPANATGTVQSVQSILPSTGAGTAAAAAVAAATTTTSAPAVAVTLKQALQHAKHKQPIASATATTATATATAAVVVSARTTTTIQPNKIDEDEIQVIERIEPTVAVVDPHDKKKVGEPSKDAVLLSATLTSPASTPRKAQNSKLHSVRTKFWRLARREIPTRSVGWLCCAPCIWLRTSNAIHKIALTTATLLVTSLLVASPILFLISTAPSQLPKDCFSQNDKDCLPAPTAPPECLSADCRLAANSIQARMNWKLDPCRNLRGYTCTQKEPETLRLVKSAQENVDLQMQQLLAHNTTLGVFRKLGRLYGSCLRQTINSSTIRLLLDEMGGYLPIGSLGPSTVSPLLTKMANLGPTPLMEISYDLSYGRKPQIMLIIDGPSSASPVLQNPMRWLGPKAPFFRSKVDTPELLDNLIEYFLPAALSIEQKTQEKRHIRQFIGELKQVQRFYIETDFLHSIVVNNVTALTASYSFLNWSNVLPTDWTGPIIVRSAGYFSKLQGVLVNHPIRIVHNSLLLMFALSALPPAHPTPVICSKATIWAMPEVASALYLAQFPDTSIQSAIDRVEGLFESLKAFLKRAPSLKGAALVKLSALRIQACPWPVFSNHTKVQDMLDTVEITSDNWFENVMKIYKVNKSKPFGNITSTTHTSWAYPTIAKPFYDPLSHSIVVPLSVIMIPYFNANLPPYLHFATVGIAIAKEMLRAITKSFEDKVMNCVPATVEIFSNTSRMDMLIHSGAMQIAYHTMLSLNGPSQLLSLTGLNLTPTQIFFIVCAQDLCIDAMYERIDTSCENFNDILTWLIAQGGSANEVFQCPYGTEMMSKRMCTVL